MNLMPKPQKVTMQDGTFKIEALSRIVLDNQLTYNAFKTAQLLKNEIASLLFLTLSIVKKESQTPCIVFEIDTLLQDDEEYQLSIGPLKIRISAGTNKGLLYGAVTLCQMIREYGACIPCCEIEDKPYFKNRGYLLDVTRGRIPSLETLKEIVDRLASYKINQLQLYIEHTFAYEKHSEVWSKTDPITAEDLLEIDYYCSQKGIELVPCIATFGHLYDILNTDGFSHLSELDREVGSRFSWFHRMRYHILNVSNPDSFKFVKSMIDEIIPLFSSNKFNICCDETFDLGKGKSSELAEKEGFGVLYMSFVNKITEYLQSKGKEVMMWGDIVLNHPDCIPKVNKDVICLNWYYYYNANPDRVKIFEENQVKQYVCPTVSGFSRIINAMDMSYTNIKEMIKLGVLYHAEGVINTDWGDSGHINHIANSIPGMIYGASLSWNQDDTRSFEDFDEAVSLIEYGDRTKKLIGIIRELSKQDLIIFNSFAFFRDFKTFHLPYHTFGMCLYDNTKKEIMETDAKLLYTAADKAIVLTDELSAQVLNCRADRGLDMKEYMLSARGLSLLQQLGLIIKNLEYGQETELISTPKELAVQFEYWLLDYCEVWRKRNKEGELFRIKEFVWNICQILRSY